MRGLFVTATGTGVGKTVLSAALLAAMAQAGEHVWTHKPVVTGLDQPQTAGEPGASGDWPPDHVLLAAAAGMEPDAVAPLRFGPAVSPHLATALAGERIDPQQMVRFAREGCADARCASVIEGVGGLLTPLSDDFTVRDFAAALGTPVLIAAPTGLGTINHTLLTLEAARVASLDVIAVVLTPWPSKPGELERSNRSTIERLGHVEVEVLSHVPAPAVAELAQAGSALPWRRWLAC